MYEPPSVRGALPARLASLFFGLFVCALGVVLLLESRLGLSPWDVLHQGISKHTPLSFGASNLVVGVTVLAGAWALGARVGFGTVANAVSIGIFVDLLLRLDAIEELTREPLGVRVALMVIGVAAFGVGTAFYIGATMGAGPRDSLMLVASRRTGIRIGAVRAAIEVAALAVGIVLGGKVGIGTLAFAALIGPCVEASFWLLSRSPLADGLVRPAAGTASGGGP
jgi:uncharacterized membrane protein YczE